MDVARRAFDWIGSVAVDVDGGQGWLEAGELFDDLYAGTAGVLLGCAEATVAGLDAAAVAVGARDRLLYLVGHGGDLPTMPDDGLFTGWAGVSVALDSWARAAGDAAAAEAAATVRSRIAQRVLHEPVGPDRYADVISGDAGVLLALLPGVREDATASCDETVRAAADALAERLVKVAEPAVEGLHWRMAAGWEYLMPGFSHGTAGVAFALAAAGRALGRGGLTEAAVRGASALLAAGHGPDGWALPLAIPPRPKGPAVFYGWCHGPAGTVRLFVLLNELDPQLRWQTAIDACLQALRDSRLPARLYPGYWDNLGRCCGTAGVGQLLLDRYQATGDTALLDWAGILAADVVDRAMTTPHGVTWANTEHTKTPPELPPEPGFMQGTIGIASWLVRLAALCTQSAAPASVPRPGPIWL